MSEPTKAVFLSYASQDAEAARRLAEALRAAGVEVWFDVEGGLETGDEWDAKIRKQIKECVLFLPVISANTQAREEGYFRIEWELAAQRALGIASGVPFILPIVIDDTKEPAALVPDRFRSVQWTRARAGELTPEAIAKLAKLWSHRAGLAKARAHQAEPGSGEETPASPTLVAPRRRAPAMWLAAAGSAIALGALAFLLTRRPAEIPAKPVPPAPPTTAATAVRDWPKNAELKRAYQLTLELNSIREDLLLAEEIARKAAEQSPSDPEAVTVLAHVQSTILVRNFDFTADRTALSRRYCERAVQLSPDDPVALVALAMFLTQRGGDYPRAETLLRRAVALAPDESRYARYLARVTGLQNGAEGLASSLRQYQAIAERFPQDPLAHYDLSIRYRDNGDFAAAERSLDAAIALAPVANAIDWKARFALMRGDLPGTRQWLDRVPPRMQSEERSVLTRVTYALFSGDTAYGLQALNRYAETWFYDVSNYSGPRSLLLGALREREGRPELARVHYEAALTEIRRYREARPADPGNQGVEAWVLLGLGRVDEARALHRVSAAGAPRPFRHFAPGLWWFWLMPRMLLLDDRAQALAALREAATETGIREHLLRRIQMDPRLTAFHQDPEVLAILAAPAATASTSAHAGASAPLASKADPKSVAVLAFANLSDDKANEYFSDGVSEELLNVLAKVPGLKVTARTSAFYFKGKDTPIPEIARQLGVAYVVEGSVRKAGDKVRITAQLIKAADGFRVWSETFTRDLNDIFAVQDEIAGLVVTQLRAAILDGKMPATAVAAEAAASAAAVKSATIGRTANVAAYQLFLEGKFLLNLKSPEGIQRSIGLFKRCVQMDPEFALAWANLAFAYNWAISFGVTTFAEVGSVAAAAGERAVRLAPELAEAHAAAGDSALIAWQWSAAAAASDRALQLAPGNADVLQSAAWRTLVTGDLSRSIELSRSALRIDPYNVGAHTTLGMALSFSGQAEEAERVAATMESISPGNYLAIILRWNALVQQGRWADARAMSETADPANRAFGLVIIYAGEGRREESTAELARLQSDPQGLSAFDFAIMHAFRGERDAAFAQLEKSRAEHSNAFLVVKNDPMLKNLHADPRWPELLRKVGLDDDQLK